MLVEGSLFIGTIVIAVVQALKALSPKVVGIVTIVAAVVVGAVIALADTHIGVVDISVAQGILIGLSSVGVMSGLGKIGSGGTVTPSS